MTVHELKILPEFYDAIKSGKKTFECRINDRKYKVEDILLLKKWDGRYMVGMIKAKVTYILNDEQFTKPNYVIMSIEVINE